LGALISHIRIRYFACPSYKRKDSVVSWLGATPLTRHWRGTGYLGGISSATETVPPNRPATRGPGETRGPEETRWTSNRDSKARNLGDSPDGDREDRSHGLGNGKSQVSRPRCTAVGRRRRRLSTWLEEKTAGARRSLMSVAPEPATCVAGFPSPAVATRSTHKPSRGGCCRWAGCGSFTGCSYRGRIVGEKKT